MQLYCHEGATDCIFSDQHHRPSRVIPGRNPNQLQRNGLPSDGSNKSKERYVVRVFRLGWGILSLPMRAT